MYFKMCVRSLARYKFLADQLHELDHLAHGYDALLEEVEEASVEPVIFAGMCIEATLYDLAACLFGEQFIEHIDKLGPLEKFFVIAQIVDHEPPTPSSTTYQAIQAVVTARNKLVHHKSKSYIQEDITRVLGQAKKEHERHVTGVSSSFRALVLLSLYFDGNIFEELRIIPSFKKPEYWESIVPKERHEDVHWCIEASKNERLRAQQQA